MDARLTGFGTDADEHAGKRASVRDSLFLLARFRLAGRSDEQAVRVRNLSAGGLMLEADQPLAMGTAVEVELRGIGWVPGRIAWYAEGRAGVALDVAIDPMKARKPVGRGRRPD
jgi:hypothetical protein